MKSRTTNNLVKTSKLVAVAGLLAASGTLSADAAITPPVNILVAGDSISNGLFATNPYSYYLQDLLNEAGFQHGVDYDFLGGRATAGTDALLSDGVTPFDPDHWGQNGWLAANTPNTNGNIGPGNLVDDLQDKAFDDGDVAGTNDGVYTTQDGGTRTTAQADVILLHIGTNPIWNDSPSTSFNTPSPFVQEALGQLETLFTELRAQWDAGNISSNACICVAQIIPKGFRGGPVGGQDDTVRNSAIYNSMIQDLIDALPEGDADDIAFKNLFAPLTDMYQIEATQELADSLGVALSDIDNDADPWVDWVGAVDRDGADVPFDESDPLALPATSGFEPIVENSVLFNPDKLHPTDVGADLIAHQWFDTLVDKGVLIPEPGSLALMMLGGFAVMARRRRS